MEQSRSENAGQTGDPRENPPTSGVTRHDSHIRKSGINSTRNREAKQPARTADFSRTRHRNDGVAGQRQLGTLFVDR
ncbi:hypothetical protein PR048_008266 [Dryococelus australis]|uniref:Uncharacterized protein n=1 Tax=Dryococelus australis TaxID=614101 RepID=A0ABQ9HXG3_9NEOP|nr:hypothetical protein PR048_008266 [Dryococelus australis]